MEDIILLTGFFIAGTVSVMPSFFSMVQPTLRKVFANRGKLNRHGQND